MNVSSEAMVAQMLSLRVLRLRASTGYAGSDRSRTPTHAHRFLDLCLTRTEGDSVLYGFDFHFNPERLVAFGWGPGVYSAELFASADEARSRRAEIKWSWDGTFDGLRVIGLGYMF